MGYEGKVPTIARGTASRHVGVSEGVVYWIHLIVSSSDGTLRLYEGSDTSGDILVTIRKNKGLSGMIRFDPPLPYEKGLYVDCTYDIQDWTLAYDRQG